VGGRPRGLEKRKGGAGRQGWPRAELRPTLVAFLLLASELGASAGKSSRSVRSGAEPRLAGASRELPVHWRVSSHAALPLPGSKLSAPDDHKALSEHPFSPQQGQQRGTRPQPATVRQRVSRPASSHAQGRRASWLQDSSVGGHSSPEVPVHRSTEAALSGQQGRSFLEGHRKQYLGGGGRESMAFALPGKDSQGKRCRCLPGRCGGREVA